MGAIDPETPVHPRDDPRSILRHMARRFSVLVLPRMLSTLASYESFWPSLSEPMPARSTALMCTNTSLPPSSGAMKPKPLVALNHLTVPVVILSSPKMRECAMCPRASRAGLIRFQRCLGEGSRLGAVNKADRLFECPAYTPLRPIKQATSVSAD